MRITLRLITLLFTGAIAAGIVFPGFAFSQTVTAPKREFRGTWVSSVYNLDWPKTRGNVSVQKTELISLLDSLKSAGINAVFFQVRPACDAFYNSPYEPWSYWLTGAQGTAPSPLYDPLSYATDEAHKRGMELHAWFNPYRAVEGSVTLAAAHVTKQHPEWILTVGTGAKKILNPGLQEVREYNIKIIMDVVRRYDIDGVHFDDYFYPYSPNNITTEDNATFAAYPRGFTNIGDWRRDNVNIFIKAVNDSIKSVKPYVKFGVSPFGIWRSGVPSGISGTDAYSTLYCDAPAWLRKKAVDYITPQLYWKIGGSQDYSKLLNWWADSAYANGRHFYPGQQFTAGYANSELPSQLKLNRQNQKVAGSVFFRADFIKNNNLNFKDSLQAAYFRYKALMPAMSWIDNVAPNAPQNAAIAENSSGKPELSWSKPSAASDGGTARKFVIYRSAVSPVDIANPENILAITANDTVKYTDNSANEGDTYYYKITTLDRMNNESTASSEMQFPTVYPNTVLAGFESGLGLFSQSPAFSGSTRGISTASASSRTTAQAYSGAASLQVVLKDNTAVTDDWLVRLLSGGGSVSSNTPFNAAGYVGFWLKTSNAPSGAQLAVTLDDAAGGTEVSARQNVISDGAWHLYQFALPGNGWSSFAGANGVVNGPTVTLDALMFYAPNASPDWTFYIDDVSYNSNSALPVELASFAAYTADRSVRLSWKTATELNNYGFEVERSVTGAEKQEWRTIGFVLGGGSSNSERSYSYSDNEILPGIKYSYRLKQIDADGSFSYSGTVEVQTEKVSEFVLFANYPNPFNPSTTINYSLPSECRVVLKVYNSIGQEVCSLADMVQSEGMHSAEWNAENNPTGVYFYRLEAIPVNTGLSPFMHTKKMLLIR